MLITEAAKVLCNAKTLTGDHSVYVTVAKTAKTALAWTVISVQICCQCSQSGCRAYYSVVETDLLLQLLKTLVILVVTVTVKLLDSADMVNISELQISDYSADLLHLLL